jgi:hypothetical protein
VIWFDGAGNGNGNGNNGGGVVVTNLYYK